MPEPNPSERRPPESSDGSPGGESAPGSRPDGPHLQVQNRQRRLPVDVRRLQRELGWVAEREGLGDRAIGVVLVSDRNIRQLNRDFHGRNEVTDVLTFDYRSTDHPDDVDAEVVVSAHRAQDEALDRGLPPDGELFLYCVHGLLHLADYHDHEPADRRRMWKRQLGHLAEAGFSAPRWQEPSAQALERQGAS